MSRTVSHFPLLQNTMLTTSYEVSSINPVLLIRTLRLTVKQSAHCHPVPGSGFGPDSKAIRVSAQTPAASWKGKQEPAGWNFCSSSDNSFLKLTTEILSDQSQEQIPETWLPLGQINGALCPFLPGDLSKDILKINPVTEVAVLLLLWEGFCLFVCLIFVFLNFSKA